MPETSIKRYPSTGIFLWILQNFSKILIYRTPPDDCYCWFLLSKVLSIDHTFVCFFLNFFPFIIDNCHYGSLLRKGIKMNIFLVFTLIYPNISMMVRQSPLDNHLPTHIRENTDFPRQCHGLLYYTQNSLIYIYFDGNTGRSLLSFCLIIFLQDHQLLPIFRSITSYIFLNDL